MKRRDFLRAATGAAGGTAVTGAAAAQEGTTTTVTTSNNTTANGTTTTGGGGDLPGAGKTVTVELVDYAFNPGTSEPLYIQPGTTVEFVWKTDNHNIHVDSQPEGANWEGHEPTENSGFTYSHTFTVKGEYHYWCVPHKGLGMVADIVVNDSGQAPGGGGGQAELDPEEIGVPFQAQYVGIATVFMVVMSLVYTFFTVKYGESRHASAPNKRD